MAGTAFVTGGSGFVGGHLVRRLCADGWTVRALTRSDAAARRVADLGATPVAGELTSVADVRAAAAGAEVAFHVAAAVGEWGPRAEFVRTNVDGTRAVVEGCRTAGVARLVHVSTEAVLMAGRPLVDVDETAPTQPRSPVPYVATKARAEEIVRAASTNGFATVVVRPRLVWGPGDTTILPEVVAAVRAGRFAWIGGGRHPTSTTHVRNAVEGLLVAAERGLPGEVYFVTDGPPVVFRDFVTRLVATAGVEVPDRSVPAGLAAAAALVAERVWSATRRPGPPPLTRLRFWLSAHECTIDIAKARRELGYAPVVDREGGLRELAG